MSHLCLVMAARIWILNKSMTSKILKFHTFFIQIKMLSSFVVIKKEVIWERPQKKYTETPSQVNPKQIILEYSFCHFGCHHID